MNEKPIKRGGMVGAGITFAVAFSTLWIFFTSDLKGRDDGAIGMAVFISLMMTYFGYIIGQDGSRYESVRMAFFKGGLLFGVAASPFILILLLMYLSLRRTGEMIAWGGTTVYLGGAILCVLFIGTGSLICGLATIVVRDYRRFHRTRPIPQFTLQELLIVVTLLAIIISAMKSIAMLRM